MQNRLGRRDFIAVTALQWLWPPYWFRNTIGLANIRFRRIRRGPDGRHYIHIHGNESTAREVLIEHMKTTNGRAYLVEGNERLVQIHEGRIDPNRMFSREGAEKNLRSNNKGWSDADILRAANRLDRGREGFLKTVFPVRGEVLIALHNNGPSYSVMDEVGISEEVALNSKEQPDEFMLCTQKSDFQVLAGGPFNVILQNKAPQTDDGSLSRVCAKRGVRYVNIEAAQGNAEGQRRMLAWAERVL